MGEIFEKCAKVGNQVRFLDGICVGVGLGGVSKKSKKLEFDVGGAWFWGLVVILWWGCGVWLWV